jgi:hypothetical protein
MDTGAPAPIDRGRGMTVADLQNYLTNLSEAVYASTQSDLAARDMRVAVEALGPFADLTLEALAKLLADAREYARTGKIVAPRARGRPVKRPAEELPGVIQSLRNRAATDPFIPRSDVEQAIREFRHLPFSQLRAAAQAVGVTAAPRMMRSSINEALVKLVMNTRPSAEPLPPTAGDQGDTTAPVPPPPPPPAATVAEPPRAPTDRGSLDSIPEAAVGGLSIVKPPPPPAPAKGKYEAWLRAAAADPAKFAEAMARAPSPLLDRNELLVAVNTVYGPAVHTEAKKKSKQGILELLRSAKPV